MDLTFKLTTSVRYDPALCEVPSTGLEHAGWNFNKSSAFYMLDFHRDRLLNAATHWGWDNNAMHAISGDTGLQMLEVQAKDLIKLYPDTSSPWELTIDLSKTGTLTFRALSTPPTPLASLFPLRLPPPDSIADKKDDDPPKVPCYIVEIDDRRVQCSEWTHYKTTVRDMYEGARERKQIYPWDEREVLIISDRDGSITEASQMTPYFWRGGRWVTPPVPKMFCEDNSGGQDGTTRRWAPKTGLAVEELVHVDSLTHGEECWLSNGARGFVCGRIKLED